MAESTATQAISEFLLARIADDEREWEPSDGHSLWCTGGDCSCGVRRERVLAECEAKRRIAILWQDSPYVRPHLTLMHLAAIYADHADYLPEWRG